MGEGLLLRRREKGGLRWALYAGRSGGRNKGSWEGLLLAGGPREGLLKRGSCGKFTRRGRREGLGRAGRYRFLPHNCGGGREGREGGTLHYCTLTEMLRGVQGNRALVEASWTWVPF